LQETASGLPERVDAGTDVDLIVFAPAAFAQSAPTVTGTVTDQSGQPVIGATIIEQGTTNGATTGVDGSYSLKLRGGGEFC